MAGPGGARARAGLLAALGFVGTGCGRDLYDVSLDAGHADLDAGHADLDAGHADLDAGRADLDAARSDIDAGSEVDAARPGGDAGGAPTCDGRTSFGTPEIVFTPPSEAGFVSSPSLSPDGLTLRFVVDGLLFEQSRASLGARFGPASASALFTDVEPIASYFTRDDGLERFVARGDPADLFVQRRARISDPWSAPAPIEATETINTPANEWDPFLSVDTLTLWLQRESMVEIRLFRTRRASPTAPFGTLEAIDVSAAGPNPGSPSLLADGSAVVFANADDIWSAPIDARGVVGAPSVLVPDPDRVFEFEPFVRPDGCELFWVRDEPTASGFVVVRASRAP